MITLKNRLPMVEQINFPSQEPPAHPSEGGSGVPVATQPVPAPQSPSPLGVSAPLATSGGGSRLPKVILVMVVVLLVIGLGFLAIRTFFKGRTPSFSNTITWWGLWEEPSVITPLIDEYQSSHPGVKIEYIKQSHQDYRERVASAFAEGKGPDIFSFHNSWVPMFKDDLDKVPASVVSPSEYAQIYYPVISSDLT